MHIIIGQEYGDWKCNRNNKHVFSHHFYIKPKMKNYSCKAVKIVIQIFTFLKFRWPITNLLYLLLFFKTHVEKFSQTHFSQSENNLLYKLL